mmetsp:Transcript_7505/g.12746  ORF Transcript_7505/g.12746 Transcript_7505/m.12746 type:complete len:1077 (-) Transcript_7505:234-3464(-)
MQQEQLAQFEAYCTQLYTSPNPAERSSAEAALVQLSTAPEYIPQCQFVLDHSKLAYAQLVAANALKKLLVQHWNHLLPQQQIDFRNYALSYLANRGPSCENFVSTYLIQLVATITKLGWSTSEEHQQIVTEVSKFLHATAGHLILGLELLQQLVGEMNTSANARSLTQQRKVSASFRDTCLFQIFQIALRTLQQLSTHAIPASDDEQKRIRDHSLQLALSSLSYDFIGTTLDDASEEMGTIQVPSSWRATMEDASTTQLFFDLYTSSTAPGSSRALEAVVLLASLRRSLFSSDEERYAFLSRLMRGTLHILQSQHGLTDHDNYHELCRLLARLKANYQLSELVQADTYREWIQLVATFTIDSFKHWQWAANSVYYLLSLWSRLVASMPYLKGDLPSQLESYVPQVITAFIHSRMELVRTLQQQSDAGAELDDPLDNEEQLTEQLDTLPSLCRFQLQQASAYVLSLFEPCAKQYSQLLSLPADQSRSADVAKRLCECEGELAWLVYIIGTVLGSHLTPSANSDAQQMVDAELTCIVLQLLSLLDAPANVQERRPHRSNQHLELALIFFMQQFRKVYVGDQATASSKVYAVLQERLHLSDHLAVLAVLMNKIVTNLKLRSDCLRITEKTLALLADLAGGYSSGKMLLKLETVHFILSNHTSSEFPFLDVSANSRLRTTFYCTLCKLLFSDDNSIKFKAFMQPFTELLKQLKEQTSLEAFSSAHVCTALIGALRDLRGIVSACSSRRTYTLFFEWIYPEFTPVLQRAAMTFYGMPEVTTPLLKLYAELVYNKAQRLTFDSSSPNGILLFRDASAILVGYGTNILKQQVPPGSDIYQHKYKGISLCLLLLTRALSGNYVNFGVFALYGDRALSDCLEVTIKLCLCMQLEDIMAYTKVCKAYFTLMELLMRNHTAMLVELDTPVLRHICRSLQEGLKSHEVATSSQCAAALEHLAAFHFRLLTDERDSPAKQQLANHLQRESELFSSQLAVLLNMIVFEDCANQWSLSRPLLALILSNDAFFQQWKDQMVSQQGSQPERQQKLSAAFSKLMTEVHPNLEAKNRDKFTQNLTMFRHELKSLF